MKTQARIGLVFFLTALAVFALQFVFIFINKLPIVSILQFQRFHFLIYVVLFGISMLWDHHVSRWVQIFCVGAEGIICLSINKDTPSTGLSLLIIAVLLTFLYNGYEKRKTLRAILTFASIFISLIVFAFDFSLHGILMSFEYVVIVFAFLFMLWIIFKDALDKFEETEHKDRERYLQIIEEATSVARDALNALEKLGSKRDS